MSDAKHTRAAPTHLDAPLSPAVGDDVLTRAEAAASGAASPSVRVCVQTDDFSVQRELDALREGRGDAGAICNFVGLVRAPEGHDLAHHDARAPLLWLEHYPGMTEATLVALAERAIERFNALAVRIVHRVGPLALGEQIVLVAVLAAHRRAAFEACECLMDQLKTQAPFWKQEWHRGERRWVQAKASDDEAAQRWASNS